MYFLHKEETLQYFLGMFTHTSLFSYLLHTVLLCHLIEGTKILAFKVPVGCVRVLYSYGTHFSLGTLIFSPFCFNFPSSTVSLLYLPFLFQMSFSLFPCQSALPNDRLLVCREVCELGVAVPYKELLSEASHIPISLFSPGFLLLTISINSDRQGANTVNQGSNSSFCKRF